MAVLWSGGGDGWRDLPAVAMPVQSKSERRRDDQLRSIAAMAVATGVSPMPIDEELDWLREQDRVIEPVDFQAFDEFRSRDAKSLSAGVVSRSISKPRSPAKKPDGYQPSHHRTGRHLFNDTGWKRIDRRDR